ncbi:MAG: M23 family metallopeptidase [Gemmatimonadales bacterium]
MRDRLALAALLCVGVAARSAVAQTVVTTRPEHLIQGTLFELEVQPGPGSQVSRIDGDVADEPLHLWTTDGVHWTGLAPAPMDGPDSLRFRLILSRPERPETVFTTLSIAAGAYDSERLNVAPSMVEPDSAARVRIARDIAQARAVSRGAHQTERQWREPFLPPRTSRINSKFGTARVFNGNVTSRHLGLDFAGTVGEPVVATNRGRVALVARFYLAGNVVYLDHGEGLISAYFHLSRTDVKLGDIVERGQVIGAVGRTGRVTGPHLHWVMRYGAVTVDPMSVLGLLGEPRVAESGDRR